MTALPSGTVTFLMTDIEGSTRLWDLHPQEMAVALDRHDRLLDATIAAHGGRVVKRRLAGDSFMAVFERASDAVTTAAATQRALADTDWPAPTPILVRMAIHTGEAAPSGDDYFGQAVNHCARLREVAHGGQTLLSRSAHSLLASRLPDDVEAISLGRHVLRDLQQIDDVFHLVIAGLPSAFPPLKSVDAFPNNLQHIASSFIGRSDEMAACRRLLADARIVTLTGPGGSGKTRLAMQLAAGMLERFPDGVWAVDLAPMRSDADVARAVAAVKGVRELPGVDLALSIRDQVGAGRELLVLDNCEHLSIACAHLIEALVRTCPRISVLSTSREPLALSGEHAFTVPALALPPADDEAVTAASIRSFDAVQLFVERAQEAHHAFTLTDANAPAVADLCRLLDGMPLALELAAPLVSTLDAADMVKRLRAYPLRDLQSLDPTVEERHRSLQRMIEWSFTLLDGREQAFFARLAVFAEGFSMAAVEAICTHDDVPADDVLDLMSALIRKSLVTRVDEPAGTRYRLLWTLRAFAHSRLSDDDRAALQERHADHYARLAGEAGPLLAGAEQQRWHDVLTAESANIDLALDRLHALGREADALEMASSLWQHWYIRSRFAAGRAAIERCIGHFAELPPPRPDVLARALLGAGTLATYQGDQPAAEAHLQRALALWRDLGDEMGEARTLNSLATVHQIQSDLASAKVDWERCLALVERVGQPMAVATVRYNLALVHETRCELPEALASAQACLAEFDRLGNRHGVGLCMMLLGMLAAKRGDIAAYKSWYGQSIAVFDALDSPATAAESRLRLGYAVFLDDEVDEAERLLRLAHDALVRVGQAKDRLGLCLHHLACVAEANGELVRARDLLDECLRLGREIRDDWVLAFALDGLGRLALKEQRGLDARHLLRESLRIRRARHLLLPSIESLDSLSLQADDERQHNHASRLASAAHSHRVAHGLVPPLRHQLEADGIRTRARNALGAASYAAAVAEGAAWTIDEACEAALALVPADERSSPAGP